MERAEERIPKLDAGEARERRPTGDRDAADRVVDDLLPGDFDWRAIVRDYPLPAVLAATVGGFLLGQRHGREILEAFRSFVDREVHKNVQSFLDEDLRDTHS